MDVANEREHILNSLRSLVPFDLVLRWQIADKSSPGCDEFISFDVEVGDGGIAGRKPC